MSRRALVTGAQGFVGRYAVAALLGLGYEVVGTGRSSFLDGSFTHSFEYAGVFHPAPVPGSLRRASDGYRYLRCDLAEPDATRALVGEVRPVRTLHLAGALRDEAEGSLRRFNRAATENLARALAASAPDSVLICGSSGSVFGEQSRLPIAEEAEPRPIGSYAESKRLAERAAEEVAAEAGLQLIVARIFNVVGPGLQPRHLPAYLAIESRRSNSVAVRA